MKPLFTNLVTTGERFERDFMENGLIVANKGDLKPWQKVLFTGTSVRDIQAGDMVMVNVDNYAVKRYSKDSLQTDMDNNPTTRYQFNWLSVDTGNGQEDCLLLNDRDILYSFEGEEVYDLIEIPKKKLIV